MQSWNVGLLVTPSTLRDYAPQGIFVALVLTFVARPVAVWLCLWPFGFSPKEKLFVSWVGLRGAVSIFLAAIPTLAEFEGYYGDYFILGGTEVLARDGFLTLSLGDFDGTPTYALHPIGGDAFVGEFEPGYPFEFVFWRDEETGVVESFYYQVTAAIWYQPI